MSDEVKPPGKKSGLWLWAPPAAVMAAFVVVLIAAWPDSGPPTRPPRLTFRAHSGWITSLAYSPDGKVIASGGQDGSLQFHEASTGSLLSTYAFSTPGQLDVWPLIYSSDGKTLVAANVYRPSYSRIRRQEQSRVKAWDTTTGQVISEFKTPTIANRLRLLPDGRSLLINMEGPDGNEHVTRRDLTTGVTGLDVGLALKGAIGGPIDQAEVSPDGKLVAACGINAKSVAIVDATSGQTLQVLPGTSPADPFSVAFGITFSPDGKTLAVSRTGKLGRVELWDVATGTLRSSTTCGTGSLTAISEGIVNLGFSPDGGRLVIASYSMYQDIISRWTLPVLRQAGLGSSPTVYGNITIVDTASGVVTERISEKGLVIGDIAVSPDGRSIAVGCVRAPLTDKFQISIWDLADPPSRLSSKP